MNLNKNNLKALFENAAKPQLFEKSKGTFWIEPYIAKHILHAHLDPETDDASRRPVTILRSAGWISEQIGGGAGRRLLDLGCGPGLYAAEFSRNGFDVTGIDYSSVSINYAKEQAREHGDIISYIHDDYVTSTLPTGFDVVTMIFGDFCTLSYEDRDLLLWKLRKVLNPGGFFILDVFTGAYEKNHRIDNDWYAQINDGFWHPEPHLVLEQSFVYPKHDTFVNQYIILTSESSFKKYNVWHHHYTLESVEEVLIEHKFSVRGSFGDLAGTAFDPKGEWIGLLCRREE
ncbi:MAG: class I SAM-dependent methyltransferase [Spirochaetales bacterium]|jgi:SAM-dependent methyltransferase|nr:class I SAM-dependent methyltransferase [Spirochaetales bacterium]